MSIFLWIRLILLICAFVPFLARRQEFNWYLGLLIVLLGSFVGITAYQLMFDNRSVLSYWYPMAVVPMVMILVILLGLIWVKPRWRVSFPLKLRDVLVIGVLVRIFLSWLTFDAGFWCSGGTTSTASLEPTLRLLQGQNPYGVPGMTRGPVSFYYLAPFLFLLGPYMCPLGALRVSNLVASVVNLFLFAKVSQLLSWHIMPHERGSVWAAATTYLWAFHPILLPLTLVDATDDPAGLIFMFVALILYLREERFSSLSALALGVAISTKFLPMLLIPLFLVESHQRDGICALFKRGVVIFGSILLIFLPYLVWDFPMFMENCIYSLAESPRWYRFSLWHSLWEFAPSLMISLISVVCVCVLAVVVSRKVHLVVPRVMFQWFAASFVLFMALASFLPLNYTLYAYPFMIWSFMVDRQVRR